MPTWAKLPGALIMLVALAACTSPDASEPQGGTDAGSDAPTADSGSDATTQDAASDAATLPPGAEVVIPTDYPGPLLIDADNLYFEGAGIMKRSLASGAISQVSPVCCAFSAMAQDATALYFTEWGDYDATGTQGFVRSVPKAGGSVTLLASGQSYAGPVAADDSGVYFAVRDFSGHATVRAIDKSGGAVRDLAAAGMVTSITAGGGYVYWGERTSYQATRVLRMTVGGGTPEVLGTFKTDPSDMTLGPDTLWVALGSTLNVDVSFDDGQIVAIPLDGSPTRIIASNQRDPRAIGLDNADVYWTVWGTVAASGVDLHNGALMRAPLAGGTPETLASVDGATGVAVGTSEVFWSYDYAIARMPK